MDLAKTQVLALITKGITTALGIVQSILVIWFLSRAEYGLVGLIMSIGSVVGVSQHLGIVDGTIREIAILKNKRQIGQLFWVSHLTRQIVTIPLSLGLVALAGFVANRIYHRPEIIFPLQLFASVLILQGLQDVLGATLTGMKKFKALYVIQIMTAVINIAIFAYCTGRFHILGFFWAIIITTAIMVGLFSLVLGRELKGYLRWPRWQEIKHYGRQVMRIGVFMYMARIAFVLWQRLPILMLGGLLTADQLGDLNISLTFGSKLTIIAMALSEVNLAWMSSLFATEPGLFQRTVTRNMHRLLVLMLLLTLVLVFFTPEILIYIIGTHYLSAQPLILIMTVAFLFYALIDIGTSSVFVPADNPKLRALAYGIMVATTAAIIGWLLLFRPDPILASLAVLTGAVLAYITMVILAHRLYAVRFLTKQLAMFISALVVSVVWLSTQPSLILRIIVFLLLAVYMSWEAHRSKLLPAGLLKKLSSRSNRDGAHQVSIICFAGAAFEQVLWTNRQHMMSRVSQLHPVLYIEPRVWLPRYLVRHWRQPAEILRFGRRLFWYEKKSDQLYLKAQSNLIPGSREIRAIAGFNHWFNRLSVMAVAHYLDFVHSRTVLWLYDTEAANYLPDFPQALVLYDCVDDHAAQAGVDRNSRRVSEEETAITERADVVTVTSQRLYELKKAHNPNTHLVLNAGDVALFAQPNQSPPDNSTYHRFSEISHPVIGTVGALDAYKIDFNLILTIAQARPDWQFVLLGAPVIDQPSLELKRLRVLPNIHLLGAIPRLEVPAYVQRFDVCIIPYKDNQYNQASFPLKFWEFMASGKPVVVSGLPELRPYQNLIGYASSPEQMMQLIKQGLQEPDQKESERVSRARTHGWEGRVETVLQLLYLKLQERYGHDWR